VKQIAYNNYDRAPFRLPAARMSEFYRALALWHRLINDPAHEISMRLLPGTAGPLGRWTAASRGTLGSATFARSLGYGVIFYVFGYASAWLLLRDLAPGVSPRLMLGFPVIPLLGNLPIAFGGLGLREQVSAAVFGRFGAGAVNGTVFSLLWFLTSTLLPGLAGLLLSLAPAARAGEARKDAA